MVKKHGAQLCSDIGVVGHGIYLAACMELMGSVLYHMDFVRGKVGIGYSKVPMSTV